MILQGWSTYFAAMAGAAAALTGLIFVGISISINKILSIPRLSNRGLVSLILLLTILIISSVCLMPGESLQEVGQKTLVIAIIVWLTATWLDMQMFRNVEKDYKKVYLINLALTQLATVPFIIGAVVILYSGPAGIYWFSHAIIFCFIKSVLDAWVLMIEINR